MVETGPIEVHWNAEDFAHVIDAIKAEGHAEGYRQAIADLRDGPRVGQWLGLKAPTNIQRAAHYFKPAVDYLEAQTKPVEVGSDG